MCLVGVVYRFPHITYPYSSCVCSFLQQHPYFLFIFKCFSFLYQTHCLLCGGLSFIVFIILDPLPALFCADFYCPYNIRHTACSVGLSFTILDTLPALWGSPLQYQTHCLLCGALLYSIRHTACSVGLSFTVSDTLPALWGSPLQYQTHCLLCDGLSFTISDTLPAL